jgi:small subunit ribosomal protein S6
MLRYEALLLAVPEITADEASTLETQLDKTIQDLKGTMLSFERWGKYTLAYPVRKYDYGVYFLTRFEVGLETKDQLLEALRTLFAVKYNELVMRHVIVRLDSNASLEYNRPESLEEVPTRDVETFLKENKMTGFLGKSSSAAADLGDNDSDDFKDLEQ